MDRQGCAMKYLKIPEGVEWSGKVSSTTAAFDLETVSDEWCFFATPYIVRFTIRMKKIIKLNSPFFKTA